MLTGISDQRVDWVPRMYDLIRMAHELSSQSPVPSGLRDLQVVLLPFGLYRLVKGSWWVLVSQLSTSA